jgi:Uma2 family endonuclease
MASLPASLSEEEYLRLERTATEKSEYHDGQMFAMSGGTANHSLIGGEILTLLRRQLPAGCRIFTADLRIIVPAVRTYLYPDCSVVCGDPQLQGNDNLLNPLLVVEVLSPSSEAYDRGKKFELYRSLKSLREYLLVHQDRRHVEHYSKLDDGSWLLREYSGRDGSILVPRLNATIPLADLYATALNLD